MSFIDRYKKRLKSSGNSVPHAIKNNTINFINYTFKDRAFYKEALLNGECVDSVVLDGKTFNDKKVLFPPCTAFHIGDMLTIDGEEWIVFDSIGNEIHPKAIVFRCNEFVRFNVEGKLVRIPCVLANSKYIGYNITFNKYDVELLEGGIFVYIHYNELAKSIKATQRFIFNSQVYEVIGIDDVTRIYSNNAGMVQMTVKLTTGKNGDDLEAKVADNTHLTGREGGSGGGLW